MSLLERVMSNLKYLFFGCTLSILASQAVLAEGEEEAAAAPSKAEVHYVELEPAFIANYQSAKLKYVKANITLKVRGAATAEAIDRHKPYIRHNVVMLLSRQDEASVSSPEGKQKLKSEALVEIVKALESEQEPSDIEEILFTSFIVE